MDIYNDEIDELYRSINLNSGLVTLSMKGLKRLQNDLLFGSMDLDALGEILRSYIRNILLRNNANYDSLPYRFTRDSFLMFSREYYSLEYVEYIIRWCLKIMDCATHYRKQEGIWKDVMYYLAPRKEAGSLRAHHLFEIYEDTNTKLNHYRNEMYAKIAAIDDDWFDEITKMTKYHGLFWTMYLDDACMTNKTMDLLNESYSKLSLDDKSAFHELGAQLIDAVGRMTVAAGTKPYPLDILLSRFNQAKKLCERFNHAA